MFYTIYLILINLIALFFLFLGIYSLNSKKSSSFMWNKAIKNIDEKNIKQNNIVISASYIVLGLCFFVLGFIFQHFSYRITTISLLIIFLIIIPTLSTINTMICGKFLK